MSDMAIKPPIGVSPHWFVYRKRITELHEAIGRYITHIEQNRGIENHTQHYEAIAQWAEEIYTLALLEAMIEKKERRMIWNDT